jgi:1-phosphatidylinositol-3-phosphate 5-kinase
MSVEGPSYVPSPNGSTPGASHGRPTRQDDLTLTSFNPFSEEDEHSSYALVSSLFSKVRNTFAVPLTSALAPAERKQPPTVAVQSQSAASTSRESLPKVPEPRQRQSSFGTPSGRYAAPPVVSLIPVVSESPTFNISTETPSTRAGRFGFITPDAAEGTYGTAIPGFPIADDARSIKTSTSVGPKNASVSKVIRRLRGEGEYSVACLTGVNRGALRVLGLSRDYWMDDESCKDCYNCKGVFTTWRRKHHCRICGMVPRTARNMLVFSRCSLLGQIFCSRCASNIIKGSRFGEQGMIRICDICLKTLEEGLPDDDDDDRRSVASSSPSTFPSHHHRQSLEAFPPSPFSASQLFSRADEPFNLFSIAESRRHPSDGGSRPQTPIEITNAPVAPWNINDRAAPPFRRGIEDEDAEAQPLAAFDGVVVPPTPSTTLPGSIAFPTNDPTQQSSIQFPVSSPDQTDFARPGQRSRVNSEIEAQTPFMRSRVQSRLNDLMNAGDIGWRTRRESTA